MFVKYYCSIFIFILLFTSGSAQNIATKDAISDIHFLQKAILEIHPGVLSNSVEPNFEALNKELSLLDSDSIELFDYRILLGKCIKETHCVHTSVRSIPGEKDIVEQRHYAPPLTIMEGSNQVFIMEGGLRISFTPIEKINGYASEKIYADL